MTREKKKMMQQQMDDDNNALKLLKIKDKEKDETLK